MVPMGVQSCCLHQSVLNIHNYMQICFGGCTETAQQISAFQSFLHEINDHHMTYTTDPNTINNHLPISCNTFDITMEY